VTGKGDTPRPLAVPPEVLEANWQATFPEATKPLTPARSLREWLADPFVLPCDGCQEFRGPKQSLAATKGKVNWLCADCYAARTSAPEIPATRDTLGDPEE
jgi:hypothetical protein